MRSQVRIEHSVSHQVSDPSPDTICPSSPCIVSADKAQL